MLSNFITIDYDMIYLLTAIGLTPGGSSTVHIYTQTVHRTTQNKQYIEEHNNLWECEPCPVLARFTLAFALQLREITVNETAVTSSCVNIIPYFVNIARLVQKLKVVTSRHRTTTGPVQQNYACQFICAKDLYVQDSLLLCYPSAILTLRLLISYIYGAPSKARNANVVYIWTYVWQR